MQPAPRPFPIPSQQETAEAVLSALRAGRRFVMQAGEPGVGKTVLLGAVVEALRRENFTVATTGAPLPNPLGLQTLIGEAIGLQGADRLEPAMLARAIAAGPAKAGPSGLRPGDAGLVLAIDDAETLAGPTLQYLWLLSNLLDFGPVKLQLLLSGRFAFRRMLEAPELDSIRQAVGMPLLVRPLDEDETREYVYRRLHASGGGLRRVIAPAALEEITAQTVGIPAELDRVLERCLALARNRRRIDLRIARSALRGPAEGLGSMLPRRSSVWRPLAATAIGALAAGVAIVAIDWDSLVSVTPKGTPAPERVAALEGGPPSAPQPPDRGVPRRDPSAETVPEKQPSDQASSAPPLLQSDPASDHALPSLAPPTGSASIPPPASPPAAPPIAETPAPIPPAISSIAPEVPNGATAEAPAPAAEPPPRARGLVLVAQQGDTVYKLYRRVYRGTKPPPFSEVAAANPATIKAGDLLVFPAPPSGWRTPAP